MGTLKPKWGPNGDQKTHFGPHGDQSPQMGTNGGAVPGLKSVFLCNIMRKHCVVLERSLFFSPIDNSFTSTAPTWNGDLNLSKWGPNGDLILSEMGTKWGPWAAEMGT